MKIKKSDVNALEPKLERFAAGLSDQERHVLNWVLARAKSASEVEISEGELDTVSGGLDEAAGFTAAEADAVEVTGGVKWAR